MTPVRRYWPVLALLAGIGLAWFELHRAGGVTADNVFWVLVAGLIVVMAIIDLVQKRPEPDDRPPLPPPTNPDA